MKDRKNVHCRSGTIDVVNSDQFSIFDEREEGDLCDHLCARGDGDGG
ncbi:MAG: hypothetical protein UY16_C0045G0004 [Candidatus Gottesmanbacteria bacterium GW2011_GWA2_47_9]|uniref:Uncharacterized protein n=1 Tax=Candidatus Gottesmanbacteria bacterium GW2011_GWA2_47_9 TaxID=1618445 RepID=A0A0G1WXJ5_9BACT|nr:MAG: hypothetical protein UY16_C0045G0004 [Candidatus Gottesmanbacteria bacterium GW2011_GWA2_47_9]